jgi:hypothetical protein
MDDAIAPVDYVRHNWGDGVAFTRSAGKHRIARDDALHALRCACFGAAQPAPTTGKDDRLLILGPARDGTPLEVVVIARADGTLLVIHVMRMRRGYAALYEEGAP